MDDDNRISITVCGDGGCGKSSITLRLVRSQWTQEYDPTIGNGLHVPLRHETPPMLQDSLKLTRNVHESEDSYSVTRVVDGRSYYLSLTDTAGQEEYRGLWAASNLRSDAFLLVYDITAGPSLDALDYFLQMIQMESDHRQDSGAVPPVKIVAGNKCDLKEGRVISSRQGLEWARAKGCGFMETSAREMVNIEETFALIVRRVVAARKLHAEQHKSGGLYPPLKAVFQGNKAGAGQPQPRPGMMATAPDKEMDMSDFAERPGAKKVKRGGFWARIRACCCC